MISTQSSNQLTSSQLRFVKSTLTSVDVHLPTCAADRPNVHPLTKYSDAFAIRAVERYQSGNISLALTDFDQSIMLNPSNSRALKGRLFARYIVGDYKGAFEDLQMLLLAVHRRSSRVYRLCAALRVTLQNEPKFIDQFVDILRI